jgi:hypothetical protein
LLTEALFAKLCRIVVQNAATRFPERQIFATLNNVNSDQFRKAIRPTPRN